MVDWYPRSPAGADPNPASPAPVLQISRCARPLAIASTQGPGLWPRDVAALYGIPTTYDGDSQCIGVIALGGGYLQTDVDASLLDTGAKPNPVIDVSVNGAKNLFGSDPNSDIELAMDIQILQNVAPKAQIVVYFTSNTHTDFAAAIKAAATDKLHRPSVISVSWGDAESQWSEDEMTAMEAALMVAKKSNVTIVAAAGDNLDTGGWIGLNVNYPASSALVLGCGGTRVELSPDRTTIATEVVWNDGNGVGTGGGMSACIDAPDYQHAIRLPKSPNGGAPKRGVPDVAALAAGIPGYRIVVNHLEVCAEGTSAATPMWAAIIALANAQRGLPVGFINSYLYKNAQLLCREILTGDNGQYHAGPLWNACTGLGVPVGAKTVEGLACLV